MKNLFLLSIMAFFGLSACVSNEDPKKGSGDLVTIPTQGLTSPTTYPGMTLIWSDEFDVATLNQANWSHETGNGQNGWGNNELQFYRPQNTSIQNGHLVITAKKEAFGGREYTSSRIITQCTETSGILEVFPASVFQNVNIRFSLIGFSGSSPVNIPLNRSQIASQQVTLLGGARIPTANLQVNTQYLTSDSRAHTCPLQQVQVQILTTQQAPRLVELDRRANENEVKLTVGNINPNLNFSVDRGPITGGRQQVLANAKGPSVTVPMGAGMEDACFSVSIVGICPSTPRLTSNVVCSSKLTGSLIPTVGGDAQAELQWTRPSQNPPPLTQTVVRGVGSQVIIPAAITQIPQFLSCSVGPFEFSVIQTLLESGFEVVVHTNTLDLNPSKGLLPPSEKLVVSMTENASPDVIVRLSDLTTINTGLNLYVEQKTGTSTFQEIRPVDPKNFSLNEASNPSGAHCFRYRDWETDRKSTRLNSSH